MQFIQEALKSELPQGAALRLVKLEILKKKTKLVTQ